MINNQNDLGIEEGLPSKEDLNIDLNGQSEEAPSGDFSGNAETSNLGYDYGYLPFATGDYVPSNPKEEYVLMPPIVQPVAVMPYISMDNKGPETPKTVSEVFEIIEPKFSSGAARVSGFLSLLFSIAVAIPFLVSVSNLSIPFISEYVQAPNIATQLQMALRASGSIMQRLPAIMLTLGLFLVFVNVVLGAASLMSGNRIRYSYTALAAAVMFVGSQLIDKGFSPAVFKDVSWVTVMGVGLVYLILEILATSICPKAKTAECKEEKKAKKERKKAKKMIDEDAPHTESEEAEQ